MPMEADAMVRLTNTWPDGTPRSQGNAFDLGARAAAGGLASHFAKGAAAARQRIKAAKEMVAGQAHEVVNLPVKGALREKGFAITRRGEAGRKKLRAKT